MVLALAGDSTITSDFPSLAAFLPMMCQLSDFVLWNWKGLKSIGCSHAVRANLFGWFRLEPPPRGDLPFCSAIF